jgi:DNA-binding response OmpR family regulator
LEQRLTLGQLELDVTSRELRFAGVRVPLSPRELALTELLMQKAGRVVTKESIVARLSSWEADFSENSVEVYVHRLRKRFGELGVVIRTIRGFGYVMEAAVGPGASAT